MKSPEARRAIADEMIRRADTVTLLTAAEVTDIWSRAEKGEFDTIFDGEAVDSGSEAEKRPESRL